MFEIGSSLREARTRRELSPADVHKAIRIRERYLTALEEERWELLPGDAYGKGFLRTYADFLGLHGQLYVDEYNARVAQHDDEPPLPEPSRQRAPFVRAVAAVLVIGAVVGALVAWRQSGSPSRPHVAVAAAGPTGREIYRGTLQLWQSLKLGPAHRAGRSGKSRAYALAAASSSTAGTSLQSSSSL